MSVDVLKAGVSVNQFVEIEKIFEQLTDQEKLYAHHLGCAARQGALIVLDQLSGESPDIFRLIFELDRACEGDWSQLKQKCGVTEQEIEEFKEYAAMFLSNLGNYYDDGEIKFVPNVTLEAIKKLGNASTKAQKLVDLVGEVIVAPLPYSLGFPSDQCQSAYYPGRERISKEEIKAVDGYLQSKQIQPENTSIHKLIESGQTVYEVVQASIEQGSTTFESSILDKPAVIRIKKGGYADILTKVNAHLEKACQFTPNDLQRQILQKYMQSFLTETYHDPYNVRGAWESAVYISDRVESALLGTMVTDSDRYLRLLPWTQSTNGNNGKGPFEKDLFDAPDYSSGHLLAFGCSACYEGVNLPNYDDIRQQHGSKNLVVSNRLALNATGFGPSPYVTSDVSDSYTRCRAPCRYAQNALHELLGHGSGRFLTEDADGKFNFDIKNPPHNPVSGKAVETWYKPGQTFLGCFGESAVSLEECRAILVGFYLLDDAQFLKGFGFTDSSDVTADELIYNSYLSIVDEGLDGLQYYNVEEKTWGQPHKQGYWAILHHMLRLKDPWCSITYDSSCADDKCPLTIRIDRSRIFTHAKPALAEMLLKIHIIKCTADVVNGGSYYDDACSLTLEHEKWRLAVIKEAKKQGRRKFILGNTFLNDNGGVNFKAYEASNDGMIRSWAERRL